MIIDKSNWIPVKLADVTIKKEENDKANASLRFNKFLKVEHMYVESFHIKRWGTIGEEELPPTFYKVFRTGQVLYPTRNPHLKRVALASFDGICGEKTLTLEPIQDLIDPRFYPFIFLAHSFFNHTTKSIIGSTNPHVRWRDVAEYDFLLPPKYQQAKLAELLWAADEVVETYNKLFGQAEASYSSAENALFSGVNSKFKLKDVVLRSIGGGTPNTKNSTFYEKGTVEWITTSSMNSLFISQGEKKITQNAVKGTATNILSENNLIVGTRVGIGKCCILNAPMAFSQDVTGLEVDHAKASHLFLALQILSKRFQLGILKKARGTTIKGILKEDLLNSSIYLPDLRTQVDVSSKLLKLIKIKESCNHLINEGLGIKKQLINKIFS